MENILFRFSKSFNNLSGIVVTKEKYWKAWPLVLSVCPRASRTGLREPPSSIMPSSAAKMREFNRVPWFPATFLASRGAAWGEYPLRRKLYPNLTRSMLFLIVANPGSPRIKRPRRELGYRRVAKDWEILRTWAMPSNLVPSRRSGPFSFVAQWVTPGSNRLPNTLPFFSFGGMDSSVCKLCSFVFAWIRKSLFHKFC